MNSLLPLAASPAGAGACANADPQPPISTARQSIFFFMALPSTSLGDGVDQHRLAGLDDLDRLLEHRPELFRISDRPERGDAKSFGHGGIVDEGVAQRHPDMGAVDAAPASR